MPQTRTKRANYSTNSLNSKLFKIPNGAIYSPPPQYRSTAAAGQLGTFGASLPMPIRPVTANPFVQPVQPAYKNIIASDNRNLMANNTVNTNAYAQNLGVKYGQSIIAQPKNFAEDMRGRGFVATPPKPQIPIAQQIMRGRSAQGERLASKEGGSGGDMIDTSTKWTRRAAGYRQGGGEVVFAPLAPQVELGSFALNPIAQTAINWRVGAG